MSDPNYNPYQQPDTYQPAAAPKGWNWGAFIFGIWWGIGNKAYLTLLNLIPLFNIVWIFVCGAMGNKWAWEAGNYTDPQLFKAVQDPWNRAGKVSFIITMVILAAYIILALVAGSFTFFMYRIR